jgi:cell division protease FtsH
LEGTVRNDKGGFNKGPFQSNEGGNPFIIVILLSLIVLAIYFTFVGGEVKFTPELSYSEFVKLIKDRRVIKVVIENGTVIKGQALSKDNSVFSFKVNIPYADFELMKLLIDNGVEVYGKDTRGMEDFINTILFVVVIIGSLLFVIWLIGRQGGGGVDNSRIFNFTKSRARVYKDPPKKVTFNDVAGIDEVKEEVMEIVDFLKDPKKYIKMGARIPKGILLVGPPGTDVCRCWCE